MQEPNEKAVNNMWVKVFEIPMNAFYAPLACSLNFTWSEEIPTAAVDGETIFYNPSFFNSLTPSQRIFVFMHEVDHVARLHHVRRGNRDPQIWNMACDYEINGELVKSYDPKTGKKIYDIGSLDLLLDHSYDGLSAEQIYTELIKKRDSGGLPDIGDSVLGEDMKPATFNEAVSPVDIINKVIAANSIAERSGGKGYGSGPSYLQELIKRFSRPRIKWEKHLTKFMTDLGEQQYTWSRRNRRHEDFYLPGTLPDEGLAHIVFFYDVSGSVTKSQITRFNTEVAHIHKHFAPRRLTVVTFDTIIHDVFEFTKDSVLTDLTIRGGGGTCLQCVYDYLVSKKPTASVIFTDLQCRSIKDPKVPIFWGVTGNRKVFNPKFGVQIPIPTEDDDDY